MVVCLPAVTVTLSTFRADFGAAVYISSECIKGLLKELQGSDKVKRTLFEESEDLRTSENGFDKVALSHTKQMAQYAGLSVWIILAQ